MSKVIDKIVADLNKKYGNGSVMDLSKPENIKPVERINTGLPSLDAILGGGLPKARIHELYGPESSGKTTLALHMLAKAQLDEPNKKTAFIDIENSFDPEYAKKLGIDLDKLIISQPNSGEQALDIMEKLCQSKAVSIIVLDSVAQLVPNSVKEKEIDGTINIATTARLLSQTIPRISDAAAESGTTLLFINQIRMMIGVMYGNPETVPGGRALRFATTCRIEVRGAKPEERYGKEGKPAKIKIIKNKTGPPGRSTELFLIFGEGFDELEDLLNTALTFGIIKKSGGWYEYGTLKEQGWQNFSEALRKDKKIKNEILAKLEDIKI
jgi:recombination protein RecA